MDFSGLSAVKVRKIIDILRQVWDNRKRVSEKSGTRKSETMNLEKQSIEHLADRLLNACAQLNGNASKWGLAVASDNGAAARLEITEVMEEIELRADIIDEDSDEDIAEHPVLKPVLGAIQGLGESDVEAVALAVKELPPVPKALLSDGWSLSRYFNIVKSGYKNGLWVSGLLIALSAFPAGVVGFVTMPAWLKGGGAALPKEKKFTSMARALVGGGTVAGGAVGALGLAGSFNVATGALAGLAAGYCALPAGIAAGLLVWGAYKTIVGLAAYRIPNLLLGKKTGREELYPGKPPEPPSSSPG